MIWMLNAFAIASLFAPLSGEALDCDQNAKHFQHTAWTLTEGAPPDIWALAQSPDGYLWLGTGAGLYRFDGVRFEGIHSVAGDPFPAVDITALLSVASGEIWIGYQSGGVSVLRDGRLTNFIDGLPKGPVHRFVEDKDHTIWMAADFGLARFADGKWQEIGGDWAFPAEGGNDLFVARDGTLWVTVSAGKSFHQDRSELVFLRRGSRLFETSDEPISMAAAIAQDQDGRLWVSDSERGARPLPEAVMSTSSKRRVNDYRPAWDLRPLSVIFDGDGGLWGVHQLGGIFHIAPQVRCAQPASLLSSARLERITLENGLTSDIAASLIRDREGNIWVGTNLGLDRFRTANVVEEGSVPASSPEGYRATQGAAGTFYVTTDRSLFRINPGGGSEIIYRSPVPIVFLHTTDDGDIWLGTQSGLMRLTKAGWVRMPLPKGPNSAAVWKFEEDPRGVLWIAVWGEGMFYLENQTWKKFEPRADLAHLAPNLMTTDTQGRKWLYYFGRPLVLVDGTSVRTFSIKDGPAVGDIQVILASSRGVLVAGEFGLARFDGQRFQTLRSSIVPSLSRITGIVQTAAGETWINGITGVVRVSTKELDVALENPSHGLRYELLDFRDGLPGLAQQDSYEPTAIEGSDGRLWFITNHGIAWIDPAHLIRNALPPPVTIRSVTANGMQLPSSADLTLPPRVANLQIDFTALSLSIPERVRFRYMLQGVDKNWIDPVDRRQAFYTSLGPGDYHFNVIAANNDGVWNDTGDSIHLIVPPTFVQTRTFIILCVAAGLVLLWLLYSLRLRQMSARLNDRLETRLGERERIARELHDTLLQGFQGLILRFQSVANRMPPDDPARRMLNDVLERADDVVIEGRDRVRNLRGTELTRDLAELFKAAAGRLAVDVPVKFRVTEDGARRELHPIVLEEVSRIGNEAIFNAFQHAKAKLIEVAIAYHKKQLILRIHDDGVGIEPEILKMGARPNHFGLTGMRERAQRIRAGLQLSSQPGIGTTIELTVAASVAYASPHDPKMNAPPHDLPMSED